MNAGRNVWGQMNRWCRPCARRWLLVCVQKSCKGYRFLPYTVDASNGLVSVVSEREHPSVSLSLSLNVPPSAGGCGGFGTSSAVASLFFEQPPSLVSSSLVPASVATPDRKDSTASIASLTASAAQQPASGPAALYLRHRLKLHFSEVQLRQKYALVHLLCVCVCVRERAGAWRQKLSGAMSRVVVGCRNKAKERFIEDLRKLREAGPSPDEKRKSIKCMRARLDDPHLFSFECIFNLMITYRQIQACRVLLQSSFFSPHTVFTCLCCLAGVRLSPCCSEFPFLFYIYCNLLRLVIFELNFGFPFTYCVTCTRIS